MGRPKHTYSGDPEVRKENLLRLRKAHGPTQKKFAKIIGVSVDTLSGWENDDPPLSNENIIDNFKVLGVDINYFNTPQSIEKQHLGHIVQQRHYEFAEAWVNKTLATPGNLFFLSKSENQKYKHYPTLLRQQSYDHKLPD
jgi:transcriptional regulator with XRE-family HTH domain